MTSADNVFVFNILPCGEKLVRRYESEIKSLSYPPFLPFKGFHTSDLCPFDLEYTRQP